MLETKRCPKCSEEKPLADFHRDSRKKDGRQSRCIQCNWERLHPPPCPCKTCVARAKAADGLRNCPKCDTDKPFDEFYQRTDGRSQSYCMDCARVASNDSRARLARERTPEEREQWNLTRRLKRFNLSAELLTELLETQGDECICGAPLSISTLYIDHNHSCCPHDGSCGRCVRGVLCVNCNTALGHIKDDPDRALALATYLFRFEDVLDFLNPKGD